MFDYSPNFWLVLAAAVAGLVVNRLWFIVLPHLSLTPPTRTWGKTWPVLLPAMLVQSYVVALLVYYFGALTFGEGLLAGLWLWLGGSATTSAMTAASDGRSIKQWLIAAAGNLLVMLLMAGILANW